MVNLQSSIYLFIVLLAGVVGGFFIFLGWMDQPGIYLADQQLENVSWRHQPLIDEIEATIFPATSTIIKDKISYYRTGKIVLPPDTVWRKKLCSAEYLHEKEEIEQIIKIINSNPTLSTKEDFLDSAAFLASRFSGSSGPFLCNNHILWIEKGLYFFKELNQLTSEEEHEWNFIFGRSYLADHNWGKAMYFFRKNNDQGSIETTEWFMLNDTKKYGDPLNLKEHPGEPKSIASIASEVEDDNFKFIRYWRGPTYRFSKKINTHALIFAPTNDLAAGIFQFNWDGRFLEMNNGIFDNERSIIYKFK